MRVSMWIFISILALITIYLLSKVRGARKLRQENKLRQSLGLPPLTWREYELDIPENARNTYRGVNFHM